MTPPTQGEHAQVAALTAAPQAVPTFDEQGFRDWVLRNLPDDTIIGNSAWWADHLTAWAKRFVTATPAQPAEGAAYAELPRCDYEHHGRGLDVVVGWSEASMRDFADRTHALRASHGQAPAATPQADSATHPIDPAIAADLERSDWTPEEALRWYAAGKHYDTVPNGDGSSSARILDNGAVASNALKSLSREYAEHKGDVALTAPQADSQTAPGPERYTYSSTQATSCAGCGEHKHTPLRIDAMGGYVCLTCIDQRLGSLLGEFGYEDAPAPVPQADSQPAPAEVADAMADSQYLAGVSAGWNAANADDPNAALQKLHESRAGYLKPLSAARAPADSGAVPAQQVVVDFAQVGTAGPFAVVDGRVSLPDATMQDLVHMLRPTFNAQAADSVLEDAARWQYLRDVREVALCVMFFGNGCTNITMADVIKAIDAKIAARKQGGAT